MKRIIFFLLILIFAPLKTSGQAINFSDTADIYFHEIQVNTALYKSLWNLDLYGPILLVDPHTGKIYSNAVDSAGVLKQDGKVFTGILPDNINIANTALAWNGKYWAMIMLPLPENKAERLDLFSHELFHRSQPALGFHMTNSDNNHLDVRDGRVYLRLEMEALRHALTDTIIPVSFDHLANALFFRKTRYSLSPGAESNENSLELNEGLAAYTGIMMSGRSKLDTKNYFEKKLKDFQNWPTFVRSFAYLTTPLYGFILNRSKSNWNLQITDTTQLTDYFVKAFNLSVPVHICPECLNQYAFEEILNEETRREEEKEQRIALFRKTFVEQPHLVIKLEKMNISFDPRNIVPLEGYGTVYPTMRVTDNWGILMVTGGALLGTNWEKIILSGPTEITTGRITGIGWILDLTKDYIIEKNNSDGNYVLKKISSK
jgi:hypothetical protein